ncbi:hypothetical protein I4U23_008270 [Adineta vaga]|nr:hypothetical protein I4U23_008270 [Adineta vaga]
MKLRNFLFRRLILSLIISISYADTRNDHEIFVDNLMESYYDDGKNVPGACVLVIHEDKPIIRRSYGFANIEQKTRVTSMTNFRLASLTKQFTAAVILLLAEDKNKTLQLDDRIREKWLPSLPENTKTITIRHLLTHTSGLIDYEDYIPPNTNPDYQLSDADVLEILSSQDRVYFSPPGSRYMYSNSGYALLAIIIERVSGKRFADFLRERIFLPLQMKETLAYEKGISTVAYRALGYSNNDQLWIETDQSQTSAVLGDGGIYSSIDDLAKWDTALYDNRLLNNESLKLAFTAAIRTDDPAIQYGMGWRISGDMIWHSGETTGFRNVILRFPRQRLTVIVLTNRNSPAPYQTASAIAYRIISTIECESTNSKSILTSYSIEFMVYWFTVSSLYNYKFHD